MGALDWALFRMINGLAGQWPALDGVMFFLATDYMVPTIAFSLVLFFWLSGRDAERSMAVSGLVAFVWANVIVKGLNLLWQRPRPFTTHDEVTLLFYRPSDPSFPANSAMALAALGWAIWRHNRRVGGGFLVLALAMGVARVYVGVHYPFDVLGGWMLGLVAAETWYRYGGPRAAPFITLMGRFLARIGLA